MQKNPVAWGLDIGHSSIKAVKLTRMGETVTVLGYAIEPIVSGEETDREEAVVKALEALATREEFGGIPVVASLSGRQIFSRTINIPVINPKKVDKMVELEARQQIPGKFDEVEWSYHLSPSPDGASNDVALFAARKELIAELVTRSRRVGINLVGVSVSSLALYNFVRFDQEFPPEETVIILDVGAENTDLVLYQGDTLWMRTLAISGNDITKAFMKKFRVSFEEAETLKRQIGESRQADKIFKVIEASLNELGSEVQRSLGFYKQQNSGAKLENIVISGNTFRLPNLAQYLADRLRYAVISLEDLDRVKVADGLDRAHFLTDLPSLGVAIGLALQATGVAKANVNLMPTEARIERLLKAKRWAAAVILALVAVTVIVVNVVYGQVLGENVEVIKTIRQYYGENEKNERDAREVLARVGPQAETLRSFHRFGNHKGVSLAVNQGVLSAMQDVVTAGGPVAWTPPSEVEEGDKHLQRLYLGRVDVPAFDYKIDPFGPLASPRAPVIVEVRIVVEDKDTSGQVSQEIVEKLSALEAPAWLQPLLERKKLFAGVQNRGIGTQVTDTFWYKDETHLDERGDLRPIEKEIRYKVKVATFECALSAGAGGVP
ncbi:MAG: type IV pilus assembly protein PilM [Planctomycetes bacterium]|nr:type IV pilus assembly protein PilM [Planctomycetota bacterium]